MPIALSFLHDYQQKRVLIFLDPESDPLGTGWFFKVRLSDAAQVEALLDADAYDAFAAE